MSRKLFAKYRSIQQAIQEASTGTVIEVEPGVYKEDVWIDRYVEIIGVGSRDEVIIEGQQHPTVEMGTDYAVIKNITIRQSKKTSNPAVLIHRGALVLDQCQIYSSSGPGISIVGNEAEPVIRRTTCRSKENVAVLIRSQGKILFEECEINIQSDISAILITDGNPLFRQCTITGSPGYGIFIEENGQGMFEDCNLYGFHKSPAIGVSGGNPYFLRCKVHDGNESGIVVHRGTGVFEECTLFGFGKEFPAVRVTDRAHPRFKQCTIKNCEGGAFLFEEEGRGSVEQCELFGFIDHAAITIRSGAHPHLIRTQIHDGDREAIVCYEAGKGILESCELYGFNGNMITVTYSGKLDLLRCKIENGNQHGLYFAQKAEGIIKDTVIRHFSKAAAVVVKQAADPLLVQCKIEQSRIGVEIIENGRGTFDHCMFQQIEKDVWIINESHPVIRHTKEEEGVVEVPVQQNDALLLGEPLYRLFQEMDAIVGQTAVKEKIREIIVYLDYLQDRKRLGFHTGEPYPFHALFIGPEDTGKGQIAHLYGQMLKELSLLSQGHVVSIRVSDLIGENVEETKQKCSETFEKAKGGILCLSQADRLVTSLWSSTSNQVIIERIEQELSRKSTEIALVLEGPEKELTNWVASHPRIEKQMNNHLVFTDYSPEEMAELFQHMANKEDYLVHPLAEPTLLTQMKWLWRIQEDQTRLQRVLSYLQQVKFQHSQRCAKLPKEERTREVFTTFIKEDLIIQKEGHIQPDDEDWLKKINKYSS
ncbi:right-handed parallel beta-helix repeat-containing protein [Hazenella coriacea]|uniref:right-handed parallel beta-helix repeat-containing protein n=1 Tax=Hazenella coriacea TaxID=1179467 RepID=UPI001043E39D|nr:right-handed parallel beta-helix repeat-containing protein [Hazenella coriacea]